MKISFPFTAICGQDDFKLCLLLCMIDPSLGGVLALGDKGTGKTTTARGISQLMKVVFPDYAFVNLPIGATEDRVLGTVKLDVLISQKKVEIQKGLLAQANEGVLYIDEVNLLNDYLMDVLLDASSCGGYFLERDTVSEWMDSKFCLVGTMNPEEGELRPQLLDRFGLSVEIKTPDDKNVRMEIMRRRLLFDANPLSFYQQYETCERTMAKEIQDAKRRLEKVYISNEICEEIAETCIQYQVEGLRADILLMKASRAYAAINHRKEVVREDLQKVSPFVLAHRSKSFSSNQNSQKSGENSSPREEKEEDTKRLMII